jgi:hypothetical protein
MVHTIVVHVNVVGPDEGPYATLDEVRQSIEEAIAGIGEFDVDAAAHEDGIEVWTIDEANADMPATH